MDQDTAKKPERSFTRPLMIVREILWLRSITAYTTLRLPLVKIL